MEDFIRKGIVYHDQVLLITPTCSLMSYFIFPPKSVKNDNFGHLLKSSEIKSIVFIGCLIPLGKNWSYVRGKFQLI